MTMAPSPVEVVQGSSPVLMCFPHVGTHVPDAIRARLNGEGLLLRDTDWHIFELYDRLLPGVTTVQATTHRYVMDMNRDPSRESLYPGQTTTGLIPETTFDNAPIWRSDAEITETTYSERIAAYHAPYHAAIDAEVRRLKTIHEHVVVYDCHSIRSVIPWLFEGTLPDFNIGTDNGKTCHGLIEAAAEEAVAATRQTYVVNGRFRGGWTTRHYGRPEMGVHAIQMELAQSTYLRTEKPPFLLDDVKFEAMRKKLAGILESICAAISQLPTARELRTNK